MPTGKPRRGPEPRKVDGLLDAAESLGTRREARPGKRKPASGKDGGERLDLDSIP